jgi:uncharacterized membrane protein YeaQ/YmgE (transglycosylase-associated protein family)
MSIIGTIVVGFIVGLIARALKPGNDRMGIIMTTLLGIAGAFVARFVGQSMGWYGPNDGRLDRVHRGRDRAAVHLRDGARPAALLSP